MERQFNLVNEQSHTQQALAEGDVRDDQLIGLLILVLAGSNVRVEQDTRMYRVGSRREVFARAISDGGLITGDIAPLRAFPCSILAEVLSCKVGMTGNGIVGRIAGASIEADGYLPNMAHDDFLTKLSKDGITRVGHLRASGRLLRPDRRRAEGPSPAPRRRPRPRQHAGRRRSR